MNPPQVWLWLAGPINEWIWDTQTSYDYSRKEECAWDVNLKTYWATWTGAKP
jgi:hypothetical protein